MNQAEFDKKFQAITKEMVEIAFEMVDFNKKEIDKVFIIGSGEEDTINYKMFYQVNGIVSRTHKLNDHTNVKFNLSDERVVAILRLGNASLKSLFQLFSGSQKEVPTLVRIIYEPKTSKFECKLSYDLQFSYNDDRSFVDVFDEWFEEQKNLNS